MQRTYCKGPWTCYLLRGDRGVEAALGVILNPVMSDLVIIKLAVRSAAGT